jgi:hypothetical protein
MYLPMSSGGNTLIQWGQQTFSGNAGSQNMVFAKAFPVACDSVVASSSSQGSGGAGHTISAVTTTGFTFNFNSTANPAGPTIWFWAIGR